VPRARQTRTGMHRLHAKSAMLVTTRRQGPPNVGSASLALPIRMRIPQHNAKIANQEHTRGMQRRSAKSVRLVQLTQILGRRLGAGPAILEHTPHRARRNVPIAPRARRTQTGTRPLHAKHARWASFQPEEPPNAPNAGLALPMWIRMPPQSARSARRERTRRTGQQFVASVRLVRPTSTRTRLQNAKRAKPDTSLLKEPQAVQCARLATLITTETLLPRAITKASTSAPRARMHQKDP
jgi:hypothetical protein